LHIHQGHEMNTELKKCSRCKQVKSLEGFGRDCSAATKRSSACKSCLRKWFNENKQRILKCHRKWYQVNKEKERIRKMNDRREHPDRIHARDNARHAKNRVKIRIQDNQWRKKNPEKVKQYYQKYCKNHKEQERIRHRKYYQTHPGKQKEHMTKKLARRRNALGSWTAEEWIILCEQYGNKCLCCGRGDVGLTADHITPLSKGGTNYIWNIQPLCRSCNSKKHTRSDNYRFKHRFEAKSVAVA